MWSPIILYEFEVSSKLKIMMNDAQLLNEVTETHTPSLDIVVLQPKSIKRLPSDSIDRVRSNIESGLLFVNFDFTIKF